MIKFDPRLKILHIGILPDVYTMDSTFWTPLCGKEFDPHVFASSSNRMFARRRNRNRDYITAGILPNFDLEAAFPNYVSTASHVSRDGIRRGEQEARALWRPWGKRKSQRHLGLRREHLDPIGHTRCTSRPKRCFHGV